MALFSIFAARKYTQPVKDDLGDKSVCGQSSVTLCSNSVGMTRCWWWYGERPETLCSWQVTRVARAMQVFEFLKLPEAEQQRRLAELRTYQGD